MHQLLNILQTRVWGKYTITLLLLCMLTGCFYGKVQLSPSDKQYTPYSQDFQLIFQHTTNLTDTLVFNKKLIKLSNVDFAIYKQLERTQDSQRPYIESYSTGNNLQKAKVRSKTKEPYINYHPITFSFCKYQDDPLVALHYNIHEKWNGIVSFDTATTFSLTIDRTVLNDVFVIENTDYDQLSISKLYWSIKYGLIRIDEKNGESWTTITKFY